MRTAFRGGAYVLLSGDQRRGACDDLGVVPESLDDLIGERELLHQGVRDIDIGRGAAAEA